MQDYGEQDRQTIDALPLWQAADEPCNPFAAALQHACNGPATELPPPLRKALALLAEHHLGVANAILGADLAAASGYQGTPGCNGSRVRRFRADLETCFRLLPIPVASTTDAGYYVPVTPEERRHYRNDLRARARKIIERAEAFELQCDHVGDVGAPQHARALGCLLRHLAAL